METAQIQKAMNVCLRAMRLVWCAPRRMMNCAMCHCAIVSTVARTRVSHRRTCISTDAPIGLRPPVA